MGGAPPFRHVELEAPGRYLSRVERHRIATLSERGHGSPRNSKGDLDEPLRRFHRS